MSQTRAPRPPDGAPVGHGAGRRRLLCFLLLALGLLATPLAAAAQAPAKVPRIGLLSPRSPTDNPHLLEAFRQGLRELGYVEGQNIAIEYRFGEGRPERLPWLAEIGRAHV